MRNKERPDIRISYELPPPYTELEMYEMKRKWKRVSKLAKTWLKEFFGRDWDPYLKNK